MKIKLVAFILSFFLLSSAYAAEYQGENIDGIEFDCSAYCYATGYWYEVTVIFDGDEATIYFSNGGYIILTLDDVVIDDPSAIDSYDYNEGVFWDLEVYGLD
jgi:hypothetical protein